MDACTDYSALGMFLANIAAIAAGALVFTLLDKWADRKWGEYRSHPLLMTGRRRVDGVGITLVGAVAAYSGVLLLILESSAFRGVFSCP